MSLRNALNAYALFSHVILTEKPFRKLDFTAANVDLPTLDLTDTDAFSAYVFGTLLEDSRYVGVGGYDEHRVIYRRSAHFGDYAEEGRCIHLGVDIWADALTPVYAPLPGVVHSVAFNDNFGDYGPTIILRHELDGMAFHTLYGHLTLDSLQEIAEGNEIQAGQHIAAIGNYPENGHWPPHLHFQLITDLGDYRGDYPGVASLADRGTYLANCPDPNLILRIGELD
ncbi:peptidoglycan DD-metalloendopeptidase family protein [Salmonirosea aquatica]|uniref:Peptidoglycan DD-metalloendopeptidase family protein n=1 Tax=Salmonirosea aquatica TaxID=2654236 RepID=A0A7C9FR32_9BACT|nr:peptidoglycan DD-metalloendopeptidase family protein [Cytophagaceae bacterium SJW1-29]